jgi:hypothetical protein
MKKLFYRLTSSRRPMHAGSEERRRVIGQSSIFTVLALAAFVSFGALLLPQAGQAQECIWDCDLGSDFFDNPGENSPGFSIVYCFDQPCVAGLGIFTGTIPTASVKQDASANCPAKGITITISGNVVAVLKDKNGNLDPESAAEAFLNIVVQNVTCSGPDSILSRVVSLTESPGAVFGVNSSITILANPVLNVGNSNLTAIGWTGCTNDKKTGKLLANCPFPLGIDASKTDKELSAKFPAAGVFALKEVYHGHGLGRLVAMRMCKGDANKTSSSISCTDGGVGGFEADAVFNFDGNWSGAGSHTFNPGSGSNPFDIITPLFASIDVKTVTASADGGTPVSPTNCNPMPSQGVLRCFFIARALAPNGCSGPVDLVVRGNVSWSPNPNGFVKFVSVDDPVCSK